MVVDIADLERRMKEMKNALALILEGTDERYVFSFHVDRRRRAGGEALTAELLDIGAALAEQWLPEVHSAIFASATVTVGESFDHFKHAVGLDRIGRSSSRELHLDSSYDFERNMAVVVAADVPDPRNRDAYLSALEKLLVDVHLAMGGSTLTLFTNRRDMEELFGPRGGAAQASGAWSSCASSAARPSSACVTGSCRSVPRRCSRSRRFGKGSMPLGKPCGAW